MLCTVLPLAHFVVCGLRTLGSGGLCGLGFLSNDMGFGRSWESVVGGGRWKVCSEGGCYGSWSDEGNVVGDV
jgi:hypothetical protein